MHSSSIVLVFCAFAVFSVLGDRKEMHETIQKKCVEKIGIDVSVVDKYNKGEEVHDEKLKCYTACIMKEYGLMKEDGTVDEKDFEGIFDENEPKREEYINGLKTCLGKPDDDYCETSFKFSECVRDKKIFGPN